MTMSTTISFTNPYTPLNGCQILSRCQGICFDSLFLLLAYISYNTITICENLENPQKYKGGCHTSSLFFPIATHSKKAYRCQAYSQLPYHVLSQLIRNKNIMQLSTRTAIKAPRKNKYPLYATA